MHRARWGILLSVILAVVAIGCGKDASDVAAEKAIESAMEAEGQDVDVNVDADTMQIRSKDGTMSVGEGTKLPADWPEDAPVYKGLQLQSAIASGSEFAIVGTTSDGKDKVAAFYKEQAAKQGWTEDTTMTQAQMTMLTYTKESRTFSVIINAEGSETSVSINATK